MLGKRRPLRSLVAAAVSACLLLQASLADAAAAFWTERQTAARRADHAVKLAALPTAVPTAATAGVPRGLAAICRALPVSAGRLDLRRSPDDAPKSVLFIHDVHRNREAQLHIAAAVRAALAGPERVVVGLEGADGPILLEPFRKFPFPEDTGVAADHFLDEGRISGAVHAALLSRTALPPLVGVEDGALYARNVAVVRESARLRAAAARDLARRRRALDAEKASAFTPRLAAFDRGVEAFRAGREPLGAHLRRLTGVTSATPTASRFLAALALEGQLDFPSVERERTALLESLARRLSASRAAGLASLAIAYRAGATNHANFYGELERIARETGVPLKSYPALSRYLRYVALVDGVDADALLEDAEAMEERGYAALATSNAERSLIRESRRLALSEKLIDFSLTAPEWAAYKRIRGEQGLEPFEAFYRLAEARDEALVDRLLASMEANGAETGVLVAGGFHAGGVRAILHRRGIATAGFVPRVTSADASSGADYLSAFTREKAPLEAIFSGEKLFLAQPPVAAELSHLLPAAQVASRLRRDPGARERLTGWYAGVRGDRGRIERASVDGPVVTIETRHTSPAADVSDRFSFAVDGSLAAIESRVAPLTPAAAPLLTGLTKAVAGRLGWSPGGATAELALAPLIEGGLLLHFLPFFPLLHDRRSWHQWIGMAMIYGFAAGGLLAVLIAGGSGSAILNPQSAIGAWLGGIVGHAAYNAAARAAGWAPLDSGAAAIDGLPEDGTPVNPASLNALLLHLVKNPPDEDGVDYVDARLFLAADAYRPTPGSDSTVRRRSRAAGQIFPILGEIDGPDGRPMTTDEAEKFLSASEVTVGGRPATIRLRTEDTHRRKYYVMHPFTVIVRPYETPLAFFGRLSEAEAIRRAGNGFRPGVDSVLHARALFFKGAGVTELKEEFVLVGGSDHRDIAEPFLAEVESVHGRALPEAQRREYAAYIERELVPEVMKHRQSDLPLRWLQRFVQPNGEETSVSYHFRRNGRGAFEIWKKVEIDKGPGYYPYRRFQLADPLGAGTASTSAEFNSSVMESLFTAAGGRPGAILIGSVPLTTREGARFGGSYSLGVQIGLEIDTPEAPGSDTFRRLWESNSPDNRMTLDHRQDLADAVERVEVFLPNLGRNVRALLILGVAFPFTDNTYTVAFGKDINQVGRLYDFEGFHWTGTGDSGFKDRAGTVRVLTKLVMDLYFGRLGAPADAPLKAFLAAYLEGIFIDDEDAGRREAQRDFYDESVRPLVDRLDISAMANEELLASSVFARNQEDGVALARGEGDTGAILDRFTTAVAERPFTPEESESVRDTALVRLEGRVTRSITAIILHVWQNRPAGMYRERVEPAPYKIDASVSTALEAEPDAASALSLPLVRRLALRIGLDPRGAAAELALAPLIEGGLLLHFLPFFPLLHDRRSWHQWIGMAMIYGFAAGGLLTVLIAGGSGSAILNPQSAIGAWLGGIVGHAAYNAAARAAGWKLLATGETPSLDLDGLRRIVKEVQREPGNKERLGGLVAAFRRDPATMKEVENGVVSLLESGRGELDDSATEFLVDMLARTNREARDFVAAIAVWLADSFEMYVAGLEPPSEPKPEAEPAAPPTGRAPLEAAIAESFVAANPGERDGVRQLARAYPFADIVARAVAISRDGEAAAGFHMVIGLLVKSLTGLQVLLIDRSKAGKLEKLIRGGRHEDAARVLAQHRLARVIAAALRQYEADPAFARLIRSYRETRGWPAIRTDAGNDALSLRITRRFAARLGLNPRSAATEIGLAPVVEGGLLLHFLPFFPLLHAERSWHQWIGMAAIYGFAAGGLLTVLIAGGSGSAILNPQSAIGAWLGGIVGHAAYNAAARAAGWARLYSGDDDEDVSDDDDVTVHPVRLSDQEIGFYFGYEAAKRAKAEGRSFYIRQLDEGDDGHLLEEWRERLEDDAEWKAAWKRRHGTLEGIPKFDFIDYFTIGLVSVVDGEERLEGLIGGQIFPESSGRVFAVSQMEVFYRNIGRNADLPGVADLLWDFTIKLAVEEGGFGGGIEFEARTDGSLAFADRNDIPTVNGDVSRADRQYIYFRYGSHNLKRRFNRRSSLTLPAVRGLAARLGLDPRGAATEIALAPLVEGGLGVHFLPIFPVLHRRQSWHQWFGMGLIYAGAAAGMFVVGTGFSLDWYSLIGGWLGGFAGHAVYNAAARLRRWAPLSADDEDPALTPVLDALEGNRAKAATVSFRRVLTLALQGRSTVNSVDVGTGWAMFPSQMEAALKAALPGVQIRQHATDTGTLNLGHQTAYPDNAQFLKQHGPASMDVVTLNAPFPDQRESMLADAHALVRDDGLLYVTMSRKPLRDIVMPFLLANGYTVTLLAHMTEHPGYSAFEGDEMIGAVIASRSPLRAFDDIRSLGFHVAGPGVSPVRQPAPLAVDQWRAGVDVVRHPVFGVGVFVERGADEFGDPEIIVGFVRGKFVNRQTFSPEEAAAQLTHAGTVADLAAGRIETTSPGADPRSPEKAAPKKTRKKASPAPGKTSSAKSRPSRAAQPATEPTTAGLPNVNTVPIEEMTRILRAMPELRGLDDRHIEVMARELDYDRRNKPFRKPGEIRRLYNSALDVTDDQWDAVARNFSFGAAPLALPFVRRLADRLGMNPRGAAAEIVLAPLIEGGALLHFLPFFPLLHAERSRHQWIGMAAIYGFAAIGLVAIAFAGGSGAAILNPQSAIGGWLGGIAGHAAYNAAARTFGWLPLARMLRPGELFPRTPASFEIPTVRLTDQETVHYFGSAAAARAKKEGRVFYFRRLDPDADRAFIREWTRRLDADRAWREQWEDRNGPIGNQLPRARNITDRTVGLVSAVEGVERLEGFMGLDPTPVEIPGGVTYMLSVGQMELYYRNIGSDRDLRGVADALWDFVLKYAAENDAVTRGVGFWAMTAGSFSFGVRRGIPVGQGGFHSLSQSAVMDEYRRLRLRDRFNPDAGAFPSAVGLVTPASRAVAALLRLDPRGAFSEVVLAPLIEGGALLHFLPFFPLLHAERSRHQWIGMAMIYGFAAAGFLAVLMAGDFGSAIGAWLGGIAGHAAYNALARAVGWARLAAGFPAPLRFPTAVLTDDEVRRYFGADVADRARAEGRIFLVRALDPKADFHFLLQWKREYERDAAWRADFESRHGYAPDFPTFRYISNASAGLMSVVNGRERLEGFFGGDWEVHDFSARKREFTMRFLIGQRELYYRNIGRTRELPGVADLLWDYLIKTVHEHGGFTGGIESNATTPGSRAFYARRGGTRGEMLSDGISQARVAADYESRGLAGLFNGTEPDAPILSSNDGGFTRASHERAHDAGAFRPVLERLASDYGLRGRHTTVDGDGEIDFRAWLSRSGGNVVTAAGSARLEADGVVVIVDDRFKGDHAGRNRRIVLARTEALARHELAELRAWRDHALAAGFATASDWAEGRLGTRIRAWLADPVHHADGFRLAGEFHRAGVRAQREFEDERRAEVAEAYRHMQRAFLSNEGIEPIIRRATVDHDAALVMNAGMPVMMAALQLEEFISSQIDWTRGLPEANGEFNPLLDAARAFFERRGYAFNRPSIGRAAGYPFHGQASYLEHVNWVILRDVPSHDDPVVLHEIVHAQGGLGGLGIEEAVVQYLAMRIMMEREGRPEPTAADVADFHRDVFTNRFPDPQALEMYQPGVEAVALLVEKAGLDAVLESFSRDNDAVVESRVSNPEVWRSLILDHREENDSLPTLPIVVARMVAGRPSLPAVDGAETDVTIASHPMSLERRTAEALVEFALRFARGEADGRDIDRLAPPVINFEASEFGRRQSPSGRPGAVPDLDIDVLRAEIESLVAGGATHPALADPATARRAVMLFWMMGLRGAERLPDGNLLFSDIRSLEAALPQAPAARNPVLYVLADRSEAASVERLAKRLGRPIRAVTGDGDFRPDGRLDFARVERALSEGLDRTELDGLHFVLDGADIEPLMALLASLPDGAALRRIRYLAVEALLRVATPFSAADLIGMNLAAHALAAKQA